MSPIMPQGEVFTAPFALLEIVADPRSAAAFGIMAVAGIFALFKRGDRPLDPYFALGATAIIAGGITHAWDDASTYGADQQFLVGLETFAATAYVLTALLLIQFIYHLRTRRPKPVELAKRVDTVTPPPVPPLLAPELAAAIPHLVAFLSADGRLDGGNPAWFAYTHCELDTDIFSSRSGLFHDEDLREAARLAQALEDIAVVHAQVRLRDYVGAYRAYTLTLTPHLDADGKVHRWILIAQDNEELAAAQHYTATLTEKLAASAVQERNNLAKLQAKSQLIRIITKAANVGHWRFEYPSDFSWSEQLNETFGFEPDTLPTLESIRQALHPDSRPVFDQHYQRIMETGEPYSYDFKILRADGTIRHGIAAGQGEHDPAGRVIALNGVVHDSTERKETARERAELLERIALATKAGQVGIWEWHIPSNAIICDDTVRELGAIPKTDLTPEDEIWQRLIFAADRPMLLAAVRDALHAGQPIDLEFRLNTATGDLRYLRTVASVIRNADGAAVRLLGCVWDESALRALSEALRREKELLSDAVRHTAAAETLTAEANRAKSKFLARMSQDIRMPINGIIDFIERIRASELTAEQKTNVDLLAQAADALVTIINDILDYTELEAGRLEFTTVAFQPRAIVTASQALVGAAAAAKGLPINVLISPSVPEWVSGDPKRLRQILLNLLSNAVKFTNSGEITLSVDALLDERPVQVRFSISDSGIGISPDRQMQLFAAEPVVGEPGLGLATCRRLVMGMGGRIGVESVPDLGSTFWFELPLPVVPPPQISSANNGRLATLQILVVDDNEINRLVLKTILGKDGHIVSLAENGSQALAAVGEGQFDVILMDMHMPVMDGLEATRAIRQLPEPRGNVPIVALTANAQIEDIDRCFAAGMNEHLAKPVDRSALRRTLHTLL